MLTLVPCICFSIKFDPPGSNYCKTTKKLVLFDKFNINQATNISVKIARFLYLENQNKPLS